MAEDALNLVFPSTGEDVDEPDLLRMEGEIHFNIDLAQTWRWWI